jgi:hypothetical protein
MADPSAARLTRRSLTSIAGASVASAGCLDGSDDPPGPDSRQPARTAGEGVAQRLAPDADAGAIQETIDSVAESTPDGGFGVVSGANAAYTIDRTLELPSNVTLANCRLTVADGTNATAIRSAGFEDLTGSNAWFADEDGVPYNFGLRNVHVDGNRAHNDSGRGIAFYGVLYRVQNVIVRDCAGDGFYSEGAARGGQHDWRDLPEAFLEDLWVRNCDGVGIRYRGPHDGRIKSAVPAHNASHAIVTEKKPDVYSGGGLVINWLHSYSNGDREGESMSQRYEANGLQADKLIGDGDPIELVGNAANVTNVWNLIGSTTFLTGHNSTVGQIHARGPARARGPSNAVVVTGRNNQIGQLDVWGYRENGLTVDADGVRIGSGMVAGCEGHNVRLGDSGPVSHCAISLSDVDNSPTGGVYYGGGGNNRISIRSGVGGDFVGWDPDGETPDPNDSLDLALTGAGNGTGRSHDDGHAVRDGGRRRYTVDHEILGGKPRRVSVTPRSEAAAADHHVETSGGELAIVYREPRPAGSNAVAFDWEAVL